MSALFPFLLRPCGGPSETLPLGRGGVNHIVTIPFVNIYFSIHKKLSTTIFYFDVLFSRRGNLLLHIRREFRHIKVTARSSFRRVFTAKIFRNTVRITMLMLAASGIFGHVAEIDFAGLRMFRQMAVRKLDNVDFRSESFQYHRPPLRLAPIRARHVLEYPRWEIPIAMDTEVERCLRK